MLVISVMFMPFLLSARGCLAVLPFGNTHNTTGVRILPAVFSNFFGIKISDTNDLGVVVFRADSGDPFVLVLGYQIHIKKHSQKAYAVGK